MKKIYKAIALLLALYLLASLALSLVVTFSDNYKLEGEIIRNRYGLLLMEICPEEKHLVIWSPFNNACDVFLLVIDWSEGLRIASDVFYYFGHW